jgi:hypothetical protein
MLSFVTLLITDVAEGRITFIFRVTRIGGKGTMLAVTSSRSTISASSLILFTQMMEAIRSSER